MGTTELLKRAEELLTKRLELRDVNDLSEMSLIKFKIWIAVPLAKKHLKEMELEADTLEKKKFLDYKKSKKEKKTTMSEKDMTSLARLEKNKLELKNIELEHTYLQLYAFYTELCDAVVSTRMLLKM